MKNVMIRSVSGILFLAAMTGGLLGGTIPYVCLMLLLLVGMLYEFYRMVFGKGNLIHKIIGITTGVTWWLSIFLLTKGNGNLGVALAMAAFVLWFVLLIQQLYRKDEKPFQAIAYTLLGFIYIALPWSLMTFFVYYFDAYDGKLLLALFIILWCSDVGAYVFGMWLGQHGKHKLFPSISPKKSWEGFIGGLLTAVAAGWLLDYLNFGFSEYFLPAVIIIALLIGIFGVFGDLIESMLKRSVGVKDSGKIMPGHGGLLDRFDAALVAFPIVLLFLFILEIL